MRDNLFQMSDRNRHCPLLAVRDLHQNQNFIPKSLIFRRPWYRLLVIADGNSGQFTVCLDLYVISVVC